MSKIDFNKPDGIIFDLDGTLWDAVETYAQGFNDFFVANKIDRSFSKSDLFKHMGMEQAHFLEKIFPEFEPAKRAQMYESIIDHQYLRIQSNGGNLFEGINDGIIALSQKYQLFIVSNCSKYTIEYFIKWAKLEPYIKGSIAHGVNYKPKFENINYIKEQYNLTNAVYVGDTDSDAKQTRKAHLPFVFVSYGFGTTEDYDLKFDNFTDFAKYFLNF